MCKNNIKWAGIVLALFLMVAGCEEEGTPPPPPNTDPTPPPAKFEPIAPAFDADSAYAYIEKQLSFGPRIPNSPGHIATAEWLASKFESFGAEVFVQKAQVEAWDGTIFNIRNIIASYNPEATVRVIVSGHWDSRPFADKDENHPRAPVPGANDGGSSTGVILELARQLQQTPPNVGIDLMLWDAEDYGNYNNNDSWCLGSQYWARNKHKPGYRARYGINLDMVGAADATFIKDGYSMQMASGFVERYWSIAHQLGYGRFFPVGNFDMASLDDHYFIMEIAQIPMVEVIDRELESGEFFEHWHTVTDDMEAISKETLKAVGQTTLEVILREK